MILDILINRIGCKMRYELLLDEVEVGSQMIGVRIWHEDGDYELVEMPIIDQSQEGEPYVKIGIGLLSDIISASK